MLSSQNLRFALRSLRRNPALVATVVVSLALSIGANTAIFSLVDSLLLRPLAGLADLDSLVAVYSSKDAERFNSTAFPNYLDFRDGVEDLAELAAFTGLRFSLRHGGGPAEAVEGLIVTPNYFSLLGAQPALGRLFQPRGGDEPAVVLSHRLWHRVFGGDPDVVGRPIQLNGASVTVIGVTRPELTGTERVGSPGLWVPMGLYEQVVSGHMAQFDPLHARNEAWFQVVGRLAPGVSMAQARSGLDAVARRLEQTYPETNEGWGVTVVPLAEVAFGPGNLEKVTRYSGQLLLLAVLVLVMTALNVGALMAARGASRRQEVAIRYCLGSSRRQLVHHFLSESLLLALMGGAAGLGLAVASWPWLERLELPAGPAVDLQLNGRLLVFTLAVSLLTGLAVGLLPALRYSGTELGPALRQALPAATRLSWFPVRNLSVVLQLAVAFLILVGSALLVRSLANLRSIDLGFDPGHILVASLDVRPAGYRESAEVAAFYSELLERLETLPGVEAVGIESGALPTSTLHVDWGITVDGYEPREGEEVQAKLGVVGGDFFQVLGIPLIAGRTFPRRAIGEIGQVVVNQAMARRYWPGRDPVGKAIRLDGPEGSPFQVIGVVGDVRNATLRDAPKPFVYIGHGQQVRSLIAGALEPTMTVLVRGRGEPGALVAPVRRMVQEMSPALPLFSVASLEDRLADAIRLERQAAVLFSGFAALALVLAAVGLYGVISYQVRQRTREVGLRMALGARRPAVLGWVLGRSLGVSLLGLAVGFVASRALGRLVASQLYGLQPSDPGVYAVAIVILTTVSLAAGYLPARRAIKIDPVLALRQD